MNIPLHIVLVEPEIPPNTGNIARLCGCTGCTLHLLHPLGFDVDEKAVRRAGLDYWQHLDIHHHQSWQEVRQSIGENRNWFGLSSKVKTSFWDVRYSPGDVLVFGPETRGLNEDILNDINPVTIPMRDDAAVRSLNLSNACSIAVFEALRQLKTAQ